MTEVYSIKCRCGKQLSSEEITENKNEDRIITCDKCNKTFRLTSDFDSPIDNDEYFDFKQIIEEEIFISKKLIFSKTKYPRLYNKEVWISDRIEKKLIRFIIEETPRIRLIADIASGATVLTYEKKFDTLDKAFKFAEEEFKRFCKGEVLRNKEKWWKKVVALF